METGCRLLLFLSVTHKQFNDRGSEKASEERRHLYDTSRLLRECERQTREAEPDGKGEKRATVTFWRPSFFWTGVSGPPESPSTLNLSPHRGEITQTANRREVNKHGVHGTWRAVDTASSVALSVRH